MRAAAARQRAMGPSPGSSKTRALTPPADAGARGNLLQRGVDWLKLAYRVVLDEAELQLVVVALGDQPRDAASYEIAGEQFELRALNNPPTRFSLSNATKTVLVGEHISGFHVQVEFRALYLRAEHPSRLLVEGQRIARAFAATDIGEVRVWRCDLFADVGGVTFNREDEDNCVTRARTQVRFQAPDRVFTRKGRHESRVTGFIVGKRSGISVRIYDKTEELFTVQGAESEKTKTETAAYRDAGWDGSSAVWRVEAELRGGWLREFGAGTPEALFERLDALWHYVVGRPEPSGSGWLRFVLPGTATRIERRQTDPRWVLVQQASFAGLLPAERIEGDSGGVSATQMVGALMSLLSSNHKLDVSVGPLDQVIREDFARAAEHVLRDTRVLDTYERRRGAARARYSFPNRKGEP